MAEPERDSRVRSERVDVLAEAADREGAWLSGRSGNYAEVVFPGTPSEIGEIHQVCVESVRDGTLSGRRALKDVPPRPMGNA